MREGPLAALFRRTDELGREPSEQEPDERERAGEAGEAGRPGADSPEAGPQEPGPESREGSPASGAQAAGVPGPASAAARQGAAPPAAGTSPEAPPRIPTPQERLRHAFSSDIPENILERPAEAGPFARSEPTIGPRPVAGPALRVVGVGGAGVNAINRMVEAEVEGVEFVAINTDLQSLQQSTADVTLHIGGEVTRGLGSGSDPDLGRQAAMDDTDRIKALVKGSDMVFIAAGAGGGTGTGAAPIVARIARELDALTVGIVTKPFGFEGSRRADQAERGIEALAEEVDTLIIVPNNRLLAVLDRHTSMVDAFRVADDVLRQGVQGISDLVTLPGLINLDFADVRTIMSEAGNALLGIGMGVGEHRATEAAAKAVASPLLETSVEGARSILLSITGGTDMSLWEVNEAARAVAEAAHPEANIIFGAMVDEKLDDQVWVTVVATAYDGAGARGARPSRRLKEPAGEPRVERGSSRERVAPKPQARRRSLSVAELEVPEFMPRS
jgi:cell division protein FtsZ